MHEVTSRDEIINAVQNYCADILERADIEGEGRTRQVIWTHADAEHIASLLNQDADPVGLFRFIDEKTGDWRVGYKTRDGREWFPMLRQMRNTRGSGLLENLGR
jgi:hypothetical protein